METEIEIWKSIDGYELSYAVSSHGRIKSLARATMRFGVATVQLPERVMKQYDHYKGHKIVFLRRPGERRKSFYVHRLVALAFIPNPENKAFVDHVNEDKKHNHVRNLRWATEAENTQYYFSNRASALASENEPF